MAYVQVIEGKWLKWLRKERWKCCDCGLVHSVEVRRCGNGLELRMFRDNRSTAAGRRAGGIKLTQKRKK